MNKASILILRNSLLFFAILFAFAISRAGAQAKSDNASAAQAVPVPARITQAIDETQLVTLKGNVHPLARAEFDQGPVSDSLPATRMGLLLQRSAEQETALRQLLDQQQDKSSQNYHAWLTPQQFATQFGPADADIQTLTGWLQSHGFQNVKVGAGRTTIEFSGNVGQLRSAFHTDFHQFLVHGEQHVANVSDPQIPAALAPVTAGVMGLHNFRPKSQLHRMKNLLNASSKVVSPKPLVTFGCTINGANVPCYGVAPADFAKIYSVPNNLAGSFPVTLTGAGITIAIVQDSNINPIDVQQFRGLFGLSNNFSASNIILDGPDPGVLGPDSDPFDEGEALLDVEWSGAVATGATIDLVVSQTSESLGFAGIDLSAIYIIDNNIAPIMSESFGECEAGLTSSGVQFYDFLWEQAASEGITVILATGDSGSDSCDIDSEFDYSTTGLGISGLASTPFNVALGGTDFQSAGLAAYWSTPGTETESAVSYIPETPWNDSCAATASTNSLGTCTAAIINADSFNNPDIDITGGGGGQSIANNKPAWQTGITPTADTFRDIPDLALFAAIGSSSNTFIITCEQDEQGGNACSLAAGETPEISPVGGTSASAPAFAGIMALILQQQGGARQGNANYVLYQLFKKDVSNSALVCPSTAANGAGATTCIFHDVVTGNNSVACFGDTPNCSNTTNAANEYGVLVDPSNKSNPAFLAVAGYDKATGLGSVNVANLATNWSSVSFSSDTPKITSSPSGTVAHGTNASFTVQVTSGSGTPSGDISLIASPPGFAQVGIGPFTLSGGSITFTTNQLPGSPVNGGVPQPYPIVAQYAGDGTFAPGPSASVNVTVGKENSETTASLWTYDSADGLYDIAAPNPVVYGTTPYIMRVDVGNATNELCYNVVILCPTGNVTETYDNGKPLNDFTNTQTGVTSNISPLNSQGFLEDLPINLPGGSHTILAAYAGDNSYNASNSNTLSLTVSAAPTSTTVSASPTSANTTTPVQLTATIATQSGGAGPTGTVTFSAGSSTLGMATVTPTAATGLNTTSPVAAFGTATLPYTFTTIGTYTVSASYSTGDTNYTSSSSSGAGNATVSVTQGTSSGSFTVAGTAATVTTMAAASGTLASGSSTITVTPSNGFAGAVAITCGTIPGVTCSSLSIASGSTTGMLTINVADPSTSMTAMMMPDTKNLWAANKPEKGSARGWWTLSAGTGFAALLLVFLPGRKRYRAALGLGLVCMLSFALGCGGGSTTTTPPPVLNPTTTQLTISATKVAVNGSLTVSATVTATGGATPNGNVQFNVDGSAIGTAPVTNGSTGNITVTASNAPAFLKLVGTHAVSAQYLGGTTTAASSSGSLSVTVTGTTSMPITGTSGTASATNNVSLTIN
jgi:Pro-kumamolisin, activation domain/Bacterial Ig-like domain (group 3)